jgi:hypothetical protein
MRQPLSTTTPAAPAPDAPPIYGEQEAPIENTAPIPDDRRGACWYALMRHRDVSAGHTARRTARRPLGRTIHWSRTTRR